MGHSRLTMSKEGMLSSQQIKTLVQEKQSQDRDEYGYQESPDSWMHAELPSTRYLIHVYSESAVRDLIDKEVNDLNSFAFYYVDQKTWNEVFRSKKKTNALEKLELKIKKTKDELEKLIESTLKENGLDIQNLDKKSIEVGEAKFWVCENCKSKINMTAYYKKNRSMASKCPTCFNNDPSTLAEWRQKLLGKAYVTKRLKLEALMDTLSKEYNEAQTEEVTSIPFNEIEKHKGLAKAVRTVISADIHH